jgi:hypothetical protein
MLGQTFRVVPLADSPEGRASVRVLIEGKSQEIWFHAAGVQLTQSANPFLALNLLAAMATNQTLVVDGPVSPRLLQNVKHIEEIFHCWARRFQILPVVGDSVISREEPQNVACFFSGGIDSWYTLLKHQREITHLILVHGFDFNLRDEELRAQVGKALRRAAAQMGKQIVEVTTNLRELAFRYDDWTFYHGPALASVALLLSPNFRKIYIASSHDYSSLFPWGSHPVLDHLWSTETTELVHDGCEATRVAKARQVAASEFALSSLRVCWENRDGAYNCGRCEKCLRTMINLLIAGALERCPTFPLPLDPVLVADLDITASNTRLFMIENIEGLQRVGGPPELLRAMREAIDRSQAKNAIGALKAYGARRIAKKGAAAVAHKLGFK